MTAIGSLRVELELDDGSFTTRIIRAGTSLGTLERQVGQSVVAVRRLDSAFSVASNAVRDFTLTLGLARAAVENIYSVFGQWAVSILRTSGEVQRLTTLLRGMSTASDEAQRSAEGGAQTEWIMNLSRTAPFALNTLTQGFVRMRAGGIEPVENAMMGLTNAVAAFGGTGVAFERAATAIQQMAGKGVISMEELRQQLGEAVPSAIPLMARAMNTTVEQLVAKIAEGRVRAEPALRALFAEMERTFGGRAQMMMTTFGGQVQQLQTNFQRLQMAAGGVNTRGDVLEGGFLSLTTKALERLNLLMQSPEMNGFAVRIGQMLGNVTSSLVTAVEFIVKFKDEFILMAQVVGGVVAFHLASSAVQTLGTALALYAMQIRTAIVAMAGFTVAATAMAAAPLVWTLNQAAIALGTFATALRSVGVMTAISLGLSAVAPAIMNTVRAFALLAGTIGVSGALGVAMNGFIGMLGRAVTSVGGFILTVTGIGPALTAMATWLGMGTAAIAGFRVALSAIALGAGGFAVFTIGLDMIGRAVEWLSSKYRTLTQDAGAAYDRIRLGATDNSTLNALSGEVDNLKRARDEAAAQAAAIGRLLAAPPGEFRRGSTQIGSISGLGIPGLADVEGQVISFNQGEERWRAVATAARARRLQFEEETNALIMERERTLAGARQSQTNQLAEIESNLLIAAIERGTIGINAAYNERASEIAEARRNAENLFKEGIISPEEFGRQNSELNMRSGEAGVTQNTQLLARYQEELDRVRIALAAVNAEATPDPVKQATYIRQVTDLERAMGRLRTAAAEAAEVARNGNEALAGGGTNASAIQRQAETAISTLTARTAQMRGEFEETGAQVTRVTALLAGRFSQLPQEIKDKWLEAARGADEAADAVKRFHDGQRGERRIDQALAQATRDFDAYRMRLVDPNMPEAQRRFVALQGEIAEALDKVRVATNGVGAAFDQATTRAEQALRLGALNSILSEVEDMNRETEQARIAALPQGRARAQLLEQIARDRAIAARTSLRARAAATDMPEGTFNEEMGKINAWETSRIALANARADRAGAGAARRQENDITRLTARLAELRAETAGYGTEEAKVTATLMRNHQVGTAYGNQMVTLARQVDEAAKVAERSRGAWTTLGDTIRQGEEALARQSEYQTMFDNPDAGEPNRQILQARARANAALEFLQGQSTENAQLMQEKQGEITEALQRIGAGLAYQQGAQMRQQTRNIRAQLAETLAERQQFALENVNIERRQQQELINNVEEGTEKRRQLEENLAAYITQRTAQAMRETEGPMGRMVREWGDRWANLENIAANTLDRMVDGIVEFVETGKFKFSDLATWFAKELMRMELRAQVSNLMKAFGGTSGIISGIAGLFGSVATGAVTGSTVTPEATQSFTAPVRHGGGLIGSELGPTRTLPASVWADAPRFHDGAYLRSDEVAAILQRGEGVFTAGQMAAIGRLNHSYTLVEDTLSKMGNAMSVPASAAPNIGQGVPGNVPQQASPGNITVNLINQSGQQLEATAGTPRMDFEGMIVDVVVRNMQRPGALRNAVRGT